MNRCQARKIRLMKRWARAHTSFLIGLPLYLIALALLAFFFFLPAPLIHGGQEIFVCEICYRVEGDPELTMEELPPDRYDAAEVLNYLSTCREQRTLTKSGPHYCADVDWRIRLYTPIDCKELYLGNINQIYSVDRQNYFIHRILDPQQVRAGLLELLDVTGLPIPVTPIRHVHGFPYFD